MSELSSGQGPKGKGPTRKRRKKRQHRGTDIRAVDTEEFAERLAGNASSNSGSLPESRVGGFMDGSGIPAGNRAALHAAAGDDVALPRGDAASHHQRREMRKPDSAPGRSKRGAKTRGSSAAVPDQTRHMRAVPKPQADVSFTPKNRKRSKQNSPAAARTGGTKLYAALDLGTNNCRLLIAVPQEPGRFRVVDGFSRIVRLGEGLSQTGCLADAAMDRTIEALKICAGKLAGKNIHRRRLIATEACRQAVNGQEFLNRVKLETGLQLEVVNQETEARLAAEGCGALMDRKCDAAVLFDIGGGSSELILVDATGHHKKRIGERIAAWTSLPLGVVTLAERFGGRNVTKQMFSEMIAVVQTHIDAFEGRRALERIWKKGRVHLLGTSGTVTTLAGFHLELPKYERRKVDGIWMASEQVDTVVSKLLGMGYEERALSPCIGRERADLVLAGCAILQAIRNTWPANRLRVADRGLREGLLAEMISQDGAWIKPRKKNRWRQSRRLHGHARSGQDFQK